MERACRDSPFPAEIHRRGFFSFGSSEEINDVFANVAQFVVHGHERRDHRAVNAAPRDKTRRQARVTRPGRAGDCHPREITLVGHGLLGPWAAPAR